MSIKLQSVLGLAAAVSLAAAAPALAHPTGHGNMSLQAWLEHLLADPYHASLAAVLAGLALLLGFDLLPRLYRHCRAIFCSRRR